MLETEEENGVEDPFEQHSVTLNGAIIFTKYCSTCSLVDFLFSYLSLQKRATFIDPPEPSIAENATVALSAMIITVGILFSSFFLFSSLRFAHYLTPLPFVIGPW